jgi:hypothetical protein
MSTTDFLKEHAAKNVWCSPEQDYQHIMRPRRLSRPSGVRKDIDALWSTIPLPTATDWYHVYQIGEISLHLLGLDEKLSTWIRADSHCNKELLLIDLYTKSGLQIPRYMCYFLLTVDGNVLVAVRDIPKIVNLGKTDLFIRFYSNAYFNGAAAIDPNEGLVVKGLQILNDAARSLFQQEWRLHKVKPGYAYGFVNGYHVNDLNVTTIKLGDYVEFVWDSSIAAVAELPMAGLPTFNSQLDAKQKYLLMHDVETKTIDFSDDIDLFLVKRLNANVYSGVYYHKNVEDAVRMVTHKDYTIPVQYVLGFVNDHPIWEQPSELSVRIHIRKSGYTRPLVNEHHRIKELYKLPKALRVMAMLGTESTVDEWAVENLELSKYPEIMRMVGREITRNIIQEAYGYNAISKLVGDTPQRFTPSNNWVELPVGLWYSSTVYEYTVDGLLLEFHHHSNGRYYVPRNPACRTVEALVGNGGFKLNTIYSKLSSQLTQGINYRFYACTVSDGVPLWDWVDVTGNNAFYDVIEGGVIWKVSPINHYTAIRSDETFLSYRLPLAYRDGVLRFTVNSVEQRTDGLDHTGAAQIPFGAIDIWLNGKALLRGLDYVCRWPEICITNKEYLVLGQEQIVDIRCTGFCKSDMSIPDLPDFGFVKYGLLSKNNRFDIRDDKVMRIVVDGKLYHRDQLNFSEEDSSINVSDVRNGAPYQVTDIIVPLRELVDGDTYTFRSKSLVVDKRISDYMTLKYPERVESNPNPIPREYRIYSPYTAKVMYDLINGVLQLTDFQGQYSDMAVREALEPYTWLLAYDPVFNTAIDLDYVTIHPHNLTTVITLDVFQYRFLLRTIRLVLNDRVDITKFINIETGFEHETPDHPHPYRD